MLTYRNAVKLLSPGDAVFYLDGGVEQATILEICDGWLKTSAGIMDFEDHGCTWWLTRKVAAEKLTATERKTISTSSRGSRK